MKEQNETPPAKSAFVKHDSTKNRVELVPVRPLEEIALAFTWGAMKYEPDNYRRGTNWRRYVGAAFRHLLAFARGEDADPETGLSHLAHAAACLMIVRELQIDGLGTDDRIKGAGPVASWLGGR